MQSRCFPFLASNFLVGVLSKSTFIEEERETGGKGWGPSIRVRLLLLFLGSMCSKTNKGEQRWRVVSKLGNLVGTYFLNVP